MRPFILSNGKTAPAPLAFSLTQDDDGTVNVVVNDGEDKHTILWIDGKTGLIGRNNYVPKEYGLPLDSEGHVKTDPIYFGRVRE